MIGGSRPYLKRSEELQKGRDVVIRETKTLFLTFETKLQRVIELFEGVMKTKGINEDFRERVQQAINSLNRILQYEVPSLKNKLEWVIQNRISGVTKWHHSVIELLEIIRSSLDKASVLLTEMARMDSYGGGRKTGAYVKEDVLRLKADLYSVLREIQYNFSDLFSLFPVWNERFKNIENAISGIEFIWEDFAESFKRDIREIIEGANKREKQLIGEGELGDKMKPYIMLNEGLTRLLAEVEATAEVIGGTIEDIRRTVKYILLRNNIIFAEFQLPAVKSYILLLEGFIAQFFNDTINYIESLRNTALKYCEDEDCRELLGRIQGIIKYLETKKDKLVSETKSTLEYLEDKRV